MRRRHAPRRRTPALFAALAVLSAAGCAGTPRRPDRPTERRAVTQRVTGETFADALRELDESPPSPELRPLRDAVARYLAARGMERIQDGDVDGAVRALRVAVSHYPGDEIARGGLPGELAPLARGVLDLVSPRGDEAHALAANRVLMALAPPDPDAQRRFDQVFEWGDRNRREFDPPWSHRGEMAEILTEAARVVPSPDLVQRAAEAITGWHEAARTARSDPSQLGGRMRPTRDDIRQLQAGLVTAPLNMAILHLRRGDLDGAIAAVSQLGEGRGQDVVTHLRSAADGGADGLFDLWQSLERVDSGAVTGVCRIGRRAHPDDARFAQCLAIAAARDGQLGAASAHLEAAVRIAPSDQRALRLAIEATVEWLGGELTSDDPLPGRRAVARARALLEQWQQRYPRQQAPVTLAQVEELAAQLELGQANVAAAQQHLERASQARPPARDAFLTLGEIAWRRNDHARALQYLQQGLDLPLDPSESSSTFRPTFLLRMGLVARSAGDEARSRGHLEQAAQALDALTRSLEGSAKANAFFLHAVALDALGRRDEVRRSLDAALNAAPESRELAARAVTFSLARGRWRDAQEIGRGARGRLTLDRTWQVYFSLWGVVATRVGRLEADADATDRLEDIARAATEHSAWTVRLAQRYAGPLTRDDLARHAQTAGQRAEAAFYEAMLSLAAGDAAATERDLRAVVATDMLRYFEYEMAWEMLARGVQTYVPQTPPQAAVVQPAQPAQPAQAANAAPQQRANPGARPAPRPVAGRPQQRGGAR